MPNICGFDMKVKGKPEAIRELLTILQNRDTNKPFFYRMEQVFETYFVASTIEDGVATFAGSCAWNAKDCLLGTEDSYYKKDVNAGTHQHGTTLERETERLGLIVELYAEEAETEEHILVDKGVIKINETRIQNTIHTEEYESVEDLNKQAQTKFTPEDFEENEILYTGGFTEWAYSI